MAHTLQQLPHLEGELASLLALHSRIHALPDRTRWPTEQVPLLPGSSRAFIKGEIVHTNDLRVHLGDGWWAEMTAKQAGAFVGRKVEAIKSHILQLQLLALEPAGSSTPSRQPILSPGTPGLTTPRTMPLASSSSAAAPKGIARPLLSETGSALLDPDTSLALHEIVEPESSAASNAAARPAPAPMPIGGGSGSKTESEKARQARIQRVLEAAEQEEGEEEHDAGKGKSAQSTAPSAIAEEREEEGQQQPLKGTVRPVVGTDGNPVMDEMTKLPLAEIVERASAPEAVETVRPPPPAPAPVERAEGDDEVIRARVRKAIEKAEKEEEQEEEAEKAKAAGSAEKKKEEHVPVNMMNEILSEDGLPISRIQIPASASDDPAAPRAIPLPPPLPRGDGSSTTEAERKAERDRLFAMLEAEEEELEREEAMELLEPAKKATKGKATAEVEEEEDEVAIEEEEEDNDDVTKTGLDKGKSRARPLATVGSTTTSSRRKRVSFSGTDHVKEFVSSEIIVPSSSSEASTSPPAETTSTQPTKTISAEDEVADGKSSKRSHATAPAGPPLKGLVIERPPAPPMPPSKNGRFQVGSGARESSASRRTPSSPAPEPSTAGPALAPATLASSPTETKSEAAEKVSASDDDDNDSDSIIYSDLSEEDDGDGVPRDLTGDGSFGMDEKMQLREAAVEYYRLKGVLQSRGGFEALASQAGMSGGEDESEFVPLNATVSQSLDAQILEIPGRSSASSSASTGGASRFRESLLPPAGVPLPTLVTGGSARGALKDAIRIGKLENGKLVVGGSAGNEEDEDTDDENDDGDQSEEDELVEAGKEALLWGMVGGVVVKEEDLVEGGEDVLRSAPVSNKAAKPAVESAVKKAPETRMDFYQNEKTVTVSVFEKGLAESDVQASFEENSITLSLLPSGRQIALSPLYAPIIAELSSLRVSSVKIELLLLKREPGRRWPSIHALKPKVLAPHPFEQPKPALPTLALAQPGPPNGQDVVAPIVQAAAGGTPASASTVALVDSPSAPPPPPAPSAAQPAQPAQPAKVSRFKQRKEDAAAAAAAGVIAPAPTPAPAPAATTPPPPPPPATKSLVGEAVERVAPIISSVAPSAPVEPGDRKPKRVSRFKSERAGGGP